MTDKIQERLRSGGWFRWAIDAPPAHCDGFNVNKNLVFLRDDDTPQEAAVHIDALEAEVARLREGHNVLTTKIRCGYAEDDPLWHTVDYVTRAEAAEKRVAAWKERAENRGLRIAELESIVTELERTIDALNPEKK